MILQNILGEYWSIVFESFNRNSFFIKKCEILQKGVECHKMKHISIIDNDQAKWKAWQNTRDPYDHFGRQKASIWDKMYLTPEICKIQKIDSHATTIIWIFNRLIATIPLVSKEI